MTSEDRKTAQDVPLPGGDFRLFVQKLAYQALISMGVLENPVTGKTDRNLGLAQTVIDDLMMIRDKTQGNLEAEEAEHLKKILTDLQRHFVGLRQIESASESAETDDGA